jgi:hypothetical protein
VTEFTTEVALDAFYEKEPHLKFTTVAAFG